MITTTNYASTASLGWRAVDAYKCAKQKGQARWDLHRLLKERLEQAALVVEPVHESAGDGGRAVVHLVESNMKKAAFLREAVRLTGAPARVHAKRIEEFVDGFDETVEIVTARALASLENLFQKAYPLLERGAQALFLKGQDVEAELTAATKYWTIDAELIPSITDAGGRIVQVRSIEPRVQPPSDV